MSNPLPFYYPGDVLRITGNEEIKSHANTFALDYSKLNAALLFYAPVDLVLIQKNANAYTLIFTTKEPVLFANGVVDYLSFSCGHMDSATIYNQFKVGDIIKAGTLFYQSGTRNEGASGKVARHIHMRIHRGKLIAPYWKATSNGNWDLISNGGKIRHYDAMFIRKETVRYFYKDNSSISDKYQFKVL